MSAPFRISRRSLIQFGAAGLGGLAFGGRVRAQNQASTRFQIACMTLPYSQYPLARALSGIKAAGYQYVAWGTTHREAGESKGVPVMPPDAPPATAKELGQKCRN